jgi:phosphonoacetate hydrolase
MQGRVLAEGWDAGAELPNERADLALAGGWTLQALRQCGRLYPTALRPPP